jgi:hypothetical protein
MILNRISKTLCIAAIAGLGAVLPANAAIISAVSGVINSGGPGSGTLTETFNQSGLSAGYTSGVTNFDSFVATTTHTITFPGYEWFSNLGTSSASVTYDLGSVVKINKMALWNEESSGIGLLDLLISTDGTTFSSLLSGLTPTDNPLANYLADVFSFTSTDLRYVRMDMSRCPQPIIGTYNSCAIGEVAFNQVAAVPVPAAGLLLLGALGGLGLMRRRRAT